MLRNLDLKLLMVSCLIFSLAHDIHGDYDLIVGGGDDDGSIESKKFKIYLSNFSC